MRESSEFDGSLFADHEIKVDKNDTIMEYWSIVRYTPETDGRGFKKSELNKLKEIISKVITDKL